MMLGPEAVEKLASAHVCVFGLGGVGSYVVEGLARSGVGELTLIDQDTYGESNINRQLGALTSTLGQGKAEVLARRVLDINPRCAVHPIRGVYCREDRERFFGPYDYIADAIDLVSCKVDLILQARERGIPLCNVPFYCVDTVAQHALSLLLCLCGGGRQSGRAGKDESQDAGDRGEEAQGEHRASLPAECGGALNRVCGERAPCGRFERRCVRQHTFLAQTSSRVAGFRWVPVSEA